MTTNTTTPPDRRRRRRGLRAPSPTARRHLLVGCASAAAVSGVSVLGLVVPAGAQAAEPDPEAPVVSLSVPDTMAEGDEVTLTASAWDPQGGPLLYGWSVSDGAVVYSDDPYSNQVLLGATDGPSTPRVTLTVSDGFHATTVTADLSVTNKVPWIETSTGLTLRANAGEQVDFIVAASDVMGDPLTCRLVPDHGGGTPTVMPDCVARYAAPQYGGTYRDRMVVDDGDGGTSEIWWDLVVTGPPPPGPEPEPEPEPQPEPEPEPEPAYDWSGFLGSVDERPVVNAVRAGMTVPVQFSLDGYQGRDVLAAGSPRSEGHTCRPGRVDNIETPIRISRDWLIYNPFLDRYTLLWQTDRSWRGQCRTFVLTLADGSVHEAEFRFR